MPPTAQAVFDQTAASYDRQRARLIPGYESLYGGVLELLPERIGHCLDLGAGTGLLAERVLAARPNICLTLIDTSAPMLAQARQRLNAQPNVEFVCADYLKTTLPADVDAIVSALSIHHLDAAGKRTLFSRIAQSLRPGGIFINADQVVGSTPALEQRLRDTWVADVRRMGASEEQVAQSLFRQEADQCDTVADQLVWMREHMIGVDCWYRCGRFAILYGVKPT